MKAKKTNITNKILKRIDYWTFLFFAVIFTILFSSLVLSLLGSYHWVLDLFVHFRFQYWLGFLICALVFILIKKWYWGFNSFLLVFILGSTLTPLTGQLMDKAWADEEELTLYLANVYIGNQDTKKISTSILEHKPDIIVLIELQIGLIDELLLQLPDYSEYYFEPGPHAFQIGALVKDGIDANIAPLYFAKTYEPAIMVNAIFQDRNLTVIGIHPPPPINKELSIDRDSQLEAVADLVRNLSTPTIIMGDFNTTPWSNSYRELLKKTDLIDSRIIGQLGLSWNADLPYFFRIPIDHVLYSSDFNLVSRKNLPPIDSDHLPILVKLNWSSSE